ncbi:Septin-type guanine nucleotide-binding (G) domain-containing protein [Choanephora cucurbitarum]|nr:Septin-type guanine nucleotide-binding (G) domain-containing protein [Choanephora cucurbitarum]
MSGAKRTRPKKDTTIYMNVMVVGASGSGKTAFVRTFCETLKDEVIKGSFQESKPMILKGPIESTECLYTVSMEIQREDERIALTLIDTPGFTSGFTIDHHLSYIAKYIDYQFARTLAEETKIKRDKKIQDPHVHSCLYFIDTHQPRAISETDKYILKFLSTRVNVIPVIGKSDTLTTAQLKVLQTAFRNEIMEVFQIPIYGHIDVEGESDNSYQEKSQIEKSMELLQIWIDEDHDEDAQAMMDYIQQIPFRLISYEEDAYSGRPIDVTTGKEQTDKGTLGRRYPWAMVECENTKHCDFVCLKQMLLSTHRDMLRVDTFERFYEQYRSEKLMNRRLKRPPTDTVGFV